MDRKQHNICTMICFNRRPLQCSLHETIDSQGCTFLTARETKYNLKQTIFFEPFSRKIESFSHRSEAQAPQTCNLHICYGGSLGARTLLLAVRLVSSRPRLVGHGEAGFGLSVPTRRYCQCCKDERDLAQTGISEREERASTSATVKIALNVCRV